jgi:putative membrane protein
MVAMMFWYGAHWMWWQASLMWAGMIAFLGLIIWGIYMLVRSAGRPEDMEHGHDARTILDKRLARGDIDADEYQRLRDLLRSEGSRGSMSSTRT